MLRISTGVVTEISAHDFIERSRRRFVVDDGVSDFIFKTFTRGAAAGDARAHYGLAKCYVLGTGTDPNPKLALKHAQASAEKNDPQGIRYLGNCYLYGRGMERADPERGVNLSPGHLEAHPASPFQSRFSAPLFTPDHSRVKRNWHFPVPRS